MHDAGFRIKDEIAATPPGYGSGLRRDESEPRNDIIRKIDCALSRLAPAALPEIFDYDVENGDDDEAQERRYYHAAEYGRTQ